MIKREIALKIVEDHIKNKNLVKHCLCVEAAMRALARHFGEDEDKWGIVGLMHDADWEECKDDPTKHTHLTVEWLKKAGNDDHEIERAILAHNFAHTGHDEPVGNLEWSLYICDELTGLIVACALIIPSKKLEDVKLESVIKKFNTPSFAAGVVRDHARLSDTKLGIPLNDFIALILRALQSIHVDLGL